MAPKFAKSLIVLGVERAAKIPTSPVIFSVYRTTNFLQRPGTTLTFDASPVVAVGGGMDAKKGIFTVQKAGYYQLSFDSYSGGLGTEVAVLVNGTHVSTAHTLLGGSGISAFTIVKLKAKDKVSVEVTYGSIMASKTRPTNFAGVLLATE